MATPIDDDTLQRFYDGDLSPLEEHGVQARIEADPAAQRRLAELGELTELMCEAAGELGRQAPSTALFASIEKRLSSEPPLGAGERWRVIGGEWLEHRRLTLVPLVAATAVAAATLMVVLRPAETMLPAAPREAQPEAVATQVEPPVHVPAVHGSQVENVDFGQSTGTVFEIDNEGVAVAVVWITDDEELP